MGRLACWMRHVAGAAAPSIELSQQGLIPWANSTEGFGLIYDAIRAGGFRFNVSRLDEAGVPTGATAHMSKQIVDRVCGSARTLA